MKKIEDIPVFIDVYMPIAGWKPRMMAIDEECDGMHTPWATYDWAFATKAEAVEAAKKWAEAEEVPFIDTCPNHTGDAPDKSVEDQLREIFGNDIEVIDLSE